MGIDAYFKEIKNNKEVNFDDQKNATDEDLIVSNLKLVVKIAHQYKGMGVPLEDLVQEGNYGLIESASKFDRNADNKFSTYAVHYIKMRMRNALNKNRTMVTVSPSHINVIKKIDDYIKEYKQKHEKEPTIKQISKKLKLSHVVVEHALLHKVNGSVSLNQQINDEGEDTFEKILNLDNCILSPAEELMKDDNSRYIRRSLNKLTDKEKNVIVQRFFDDKTLQQIGDDLGMTPAGVKAVQDRSLKKLKTIL